MISKEINHIYWRWQEAIRERFENDGDQLTVAKPSNDGHLSVLKEMMLKKGFTTEEANSVVLILEKDKDDDYTSIGFNSYALKKDLPNNWKKGDKIPDGVQRFTKDNSGNYKPVGSDDGKKDDTSKEKSKMNPNYDETNIDGDHLTNKGSKDDSKDKPKEKGVVAGDPNEGDNEVKNDMIKYGYGNFQKNTGTKPAPGGAGSAFNEIMSGEGVHVLEENPNMSDEELAMKLYEMTENSELGKEQKKTTGIGKKDMPDGFEGNENLMSKCIVSARSARKKHERTQKRIKRLQDQDKFGEPQKTSTFYGAQSSIDAQVQMVEDATQVLLPNGQVVDKEDAKSFIKAGGGGMNPSDTATFVQDDKGNLLIQFHSDKTTTNDIQDNSTLLKEGENYKSYLKEENLTDGENELAENLIDEYSEKIKKIEENYNSQAIPIAQRLSELSSEDQAKIVEEDKGTMKKNLDVAIFGKAAFDKGNFEKVSGKYQQYLPPGVDPKDLTTEQKIEMVQRMVSDGMGKGPDTKVINKVSEALLRKNPEIKGLNVKKNLSDQREKVVGLQRERLNRLNKIKPGLGTAMEANEAQRAFHLDMMDYPPKEYEEGNPKSLMGASLDVNMGGNIVNGKVLRDCLGVNNTKEFKERFRLVENDELQYADKEKTIVTGKNVFAYAIDTKTGRRIEIGVKTYRSKDGAAGKTNNTMTYSKGMQNCFKTGEKP